MKAIKGVIMLLASFVPTRLPVGAKAHEKWATAVIKLSGKAIPDNSSTRFALSCMIMHLGATVDRKPKRFFVKQLRKASANEVAHAVATQYKEKQKQEEADAKAIAAQTAL